MHIDQAICEFLTHRELRNVAKDTLTLYRRFLRDWTYWRISHHYPADIITVSIEELQKFFLYLRNDHRPHEGNSHRPPAKSKGMAPNTIDTYYRIIRAFWNFCGAKGYLNEGQKGFFSPDALPHPHIEITPRDTYSDKEIQDLLKAARGMENQEESWRNQAIILMLLESGMRATELCSLVDENVDVEKRRAFIRGKGGKWRWVFWHPPTDRALRNYLAHRRGEQGGPLFRGMNSRNDGKRLSRDAVRSMLRRLADIAGIELVEGAPIHAFRHTFAHDALDAELDISQLAQLMGHSNIQTTMRYVQEHPDKLQKIHAKMFS